MRTRLHQFPSLLVFLLLLSLMQLITACQGISPISRPDRKLLSSGRVEKKANYSQIPPSFTANEGQFDPEVKFAMRYSGMMFYFTPSQIVYVLTSTKSNAFRAMRIEPGEGEGLEQVDIATHVIRLMFLGADSNSLIEATDVQRYRSNYFIGLCRNPPLGEV